MLGIDMAPEIPDPVACAATQQHESPSMKAGSRPRRTFAPVFVLYLFLATILALVFFLSRERSTFVALLNPEQLFEEGADEQARLEATKRAILLSLNEDINQETRGREQEDNRFLVRLDRLWRSVRYYVSPQESRPPSLDGRDSLQAVQSRPRRADPVSPERRSVSEEIELEDVLRNIFSLLEETIGVSSRRAAWGEPQPKTPVPAVATLENEALQVPATVGSGGARALDELLHNLEPRVGLRTRGVAWRVHPNLTLEGSVDTTKVGQIDGDLNDFGFRSMHALTSLRDMSRPVLMAHDGRIDSGYPRSYGIGLNFRLTPAMQMFFDYSHEYPSDHVIEYRGTWESSLLADYSKKQPEDAYDDSSIHNFFFGLRYLHRLKDALIPVHTGFFYSTNMAEESSPSDVSMGFSVGGGYQKNVLQVGVSYRLRVWENPDYAFLMALADEDMRTRVSNQVLFYVAF